MVDSWLACNYLSCSVSTFSQNDPSKVTINNQKRTRAIHGVARAFRHYLRRTIFQGFPSERRIFRPPLVMVIRKITSKSFGSCMFAFLKKGRPPQNEQLTQFLTGWLPRLWSGCFLSNPAWGDFSHRHRQSKGRNSDQLRLFFRWLRGQCTYEIQTRHGTSLWI